MKKTVIFSVKGCSAYLFSATALSVEFRKNGYKTILVAEDCGETCIKNEFDEVCFLPKLNSYLNLFIYLPYIFFLSFIISIKGNVLIAYGGRISFFFRMFFYLFKKIFFVVQLNVNIRKYDKFLLYKAKTIFYMFSKTEFLKKSVNILLTGVPLMNQYKFSFIKHNNENFIISFFLSDKDLRECLSVLSKELPYEFKQKIIINVKNGKSFIFNDILRFQDVLIGDIDSDDFVSIYKSHLTICYPDCVMLGKISAIGRPIFLFKKNESKLKNAINYCELNAGVMGGYDILIDFIKKLIKNELFFYQKCKDSSLGMLTNGKVDIFNKIDSYLR